MQSDIMVACVVHIHNHLKHTCRELSIWTPVNSSKKESTPVYYHGDSAIKYVCNVQYSPLMIMVWTCKQ